MSARFRIRTAQGQELSFASQAVFVEFVRSGDLAPEDLLYDGETNEWAPARTHPLVLEIRYELEEAERAAAPPSPEPSAPAHAPESKSGGATMEDLGLELAPPAEGLSPEEEAAAFLKKMEAERAMDLDVAADLGGLRITMEDSSSLGDMISAPGDRRASGAASARPSSSPPPAQGAPERKRKSSGKDGPPPPTKPVATGEPRSSPSPPREASRSRARSAEPSKRSGSKARVERASRPAAARSGDTRAERKREGRGALKLVLLALAAAVVAVGVYFATSLLEGADLADPPDAEAVSAASSSPPTPPPLAATADAGPASRPSAPVASATPVLPATPEAVAARAQERFLTTTQGLLRDLEPIPEAWLSAAYFTLPSDHQRVRNTWQEYLATARRVRAGEDLRYRAAYERALDEAAVVGEMRQARLAAALDAFAAHADARRAHWDHAEALALAAIRSHDALVEAEGLVLHDASGISGRPQGVGAGVSGRDAETRLLLTQIVELLDARLQADGHGPREPANVREWLWSGFLDVVTH